MFACLWDKRDKYYRNNMKRDAAWKQVSVQMDITGKQYLYLLFYLYCSEMFSFSADRDRGKGVLEKSKRLTSLSRVKKR